MFIENGANPLVVYCAQVARIFHNGEPKFTDMWTPVLEHINSKLPSGSGFDSGSTFEIDSSSPDRLVFNTSFHHMNDVGYYDGWTGHNVIVTPSFDGFNIRVTGKNRNDIKDYIGEVFHDILSEYVKTSFDRESQEMNLVPAAYDYGFNGPIEYVA